MSEQGSINTETLHADLDLERLHNGQIIVYTVKSAKREVTDIWVESIKKEILATPNNQPFIALYDVTPIMAVTPYAKAKLQELSDYTHSDEKYTEKYGYIAFLLSNSMLNTIVRRFVNFDLGRKRAGKYERQIFQDKDQALAWLESNIGASRPD